VNSPAKKWLSQNDAETIFERLEQHGKTWKIYVAEPMAISFHGLIHYPRLKDRLATHVVPFAEFERDAAAGALPDFSLIEPNLIRGHGDYHPAFGRSLGTSFDAGSLDPPASVLAGEAFLQRIFDAYRASTSAAGSNVWNTSLLIGWDEPGGTFDHVPPGTAAPPDPDAPVGEMGFRFDRSGYRVPAILVSPWIPQGSVFDDEYRHTSLIATLRKRWSLGEPLTRRDASARTFDDLFTLDEPRDPQSWATVAAHPVPAWQLDEDALNKGLSGLGKTIAPGVIAHARELGVDVPAQGDGSADLTPAAILGLLKQAALHYFPKLAPAP
jgi:phospholipase C